MNLLDYPSNARFYDEVFRAPNRAREGMGPLAQYLRRLESQQVRSKRDAAELAIRTLGISFTVYSDGANIDRQWPFDIVPRIIHGSEWDGIEQGLKQRLQALNQFITDIYNEQHIIKEGIIPADILLSSRDYRPECQGVKPKYNVWAHICGSDLIRDHTGQFLVLEDNLRVPSGVSYMLENRNVSKRVVPIAQ